MKSKTGVPPKVVYFARHAHNDLGDIATHGAWQPNCPLNLDGTQYAGRMSRRLHDLQFAYLAHSPFVRAKETAYLLRPDGDWLIEPNLAPDRKQIRTVDDLFRRLPPEKHPSTARALEDLLPGYVTGLGERAKHAVERALEELRPGQVALLVSHQPLIGVVRHLFDPARFPFDGEELQKGEVYCMPFSSVDGRLMGASIVSLTR